MPVFLCLGLRVFVSPTVFASVSGCARVSVVCAACVAARWLLTARTKAFIDGQVVWKTLLLRESSKGLSVLEHDSRTGGGAGREQKRGPWPKEGVAGKVSGWEPHHSCGKGAPHQ